MIMFPLSKLILSTANGFRRISVFNAASYFPEENARPVDPLYNVNNEQVSLADAYPFLIIGQSSLDDLNSQVTSTSTHQSF